MTREGVGARDADSVTASEVIFLALGLGLGIVSGAALMEVFRARPPVPRQVRVTVEPGAIPRHRRSTLSADAYTLSGSEPAAGGPGDRRTEDIPIPVSAVDRRTAVRSGPGVGVFATPVEAAAPTPGRTMEPTFPPVDPGGTTGPTGPTGALVGIPISGGTDPVMAAVRVHAMSSAMWTGDIVVGGRESVPRPEVAHVSAPIAMLTAVAVLERPVAGSAPDESGADAVEASADAGSAGGSSTQIGADTTDTCAGERRIAAERCGLAVRARAGATTAADAIRAAQRAYDEHVTRAEAAAAMSDPRAVRREKETAQASFRKLYNGAKSTDDAEAAARDWLVEINDINATARAAAATAKRERAAATTIGTSLERMALEADAARIAAETAEAACMAARVSLAECDERSAAGVAAPLPQAPWTERPGPGDEDEEALAVALTSGGTPTVFRLLRGDRSALIALVDKLGGDDPVARRRWQLTLSNLVDAIVAVSIEAGALDFPTEHPFWGAFTLVQDREIAQALASLGHRFDGLGGFADDRVPSQRDMSLALGYAGLDPMRIRQWPTETEMAELYREVSVAAAEHLAATAGDLSLSELVALLGRRADGLADLWNEWGHVRPLLLEGA